MILLNLLLFKNFDSLFCKLLKIVLISIPGQETCIHSPTFFFGIVGNYIPVVVNSKCTLNFTFDFFFLHLTLVSLADLQSINQDIYLGHVQYDK